MLGDINTAVQDPNAEKEESKLSKFLNWTNLAAQSGLGIFNAYNSIQDAKFGDLSKATKIMEAKKAGVPQSEIDKLLGN